MVLDSQLDLLDEKQQALAELQSEVEQLRVGITRQLLVDGDRRGTLRFLGMLPQHHPLKSVLILAESVADNG